MCLFSSVALITGLIVIARQSAVQNQIGRLSWRVDALEAQSRTQTAQIEDLRQRLNADGPPNPKPPVIEAKSDPLPPVLEPRQPAEPGPAIRQPKPLPVLPEAGPAPLPRPEPQSQPVASAPPNGSSFELQIGKVWLVRLGVTLVLTGLVYLARMGYAGISDAARPYVNASLIYLVSFGLLSSGLWLHRRFERLKNYAAALTGGGMAAVYFSTYALYYVQRPYLGLIESPIVAGVLLAAWAIFIVTVATHRRSEVMAMFAIASAYYASYVPLIHDPTGGHAVFTLASNVALAIAATVFVVRNRWANLPFLSLVTTLVGFAYWRFVHPAGHAAGFWEGAGFLTAYWIVFTFAGIFTQHERMTALRRSTFIYLNNAAYFCLVTLTLLQSPLRSDYWVFPMAFGVALAGLHALVRNKLADEKSLANVLLAKASFLIALGIALNFEFVHVSWNIAVMGLVFAGCGWAMRSWQLFGVGQLAVWSGAAIVAPQVLLPDSELTPGMALIAPILLLANAVVLDRNRAAVVERLAIPEKIIVPFGAVAQATAVLVALVITLDAIADERLLWVLPVVGMALSAGALMLRLTPALMAAQAWVVLAAFLSPLKMYGGNAEMMLSIIPGLALLGMSHFLLHARALIEDQERPLAKLAKANTSVYFLFGWLLMLAWGYSFVPAKFLFITFTAVAIGHVLAHARRTRFERLLVGGAFALLGWMMFGWHCLAHWHEPVAWDGLAFALMLGAQYFARQRDRENVVSDSVHSLLIVIINLSLWVWASRMVPGDLDVLTWGLLGGIYVGLGLYAAERTHRIFGLIVMLAATCNLVFLAWSKLDGVPRILTFMGMGVILIVLSGLYHKYQEKLKEYL